MDNLGYLPIRGTDFSSMVCAICVKKLNLKTVRELRRKPRR